MDSSPADRPVFVLQRAGDNRSTWHRALAGPADYLEVGVRLQRGRAVSQHDPLVHPRLPFLTQRNQAPRLRIPVRALELGEARAPGRIFLDLKGLIPTLLGALERSGSRSGALASTPIWAQLDRLAEQAPEIERYYTVRPREAASGVGSHTCAAQRRGEGESGYPCTASGDPEARAATRRAPTARHLLYDQRCGNWPAPSRRRRGGDYFGPGRSDRTLAGSVWAGGLNASS